MAASKSYPFAIFFSQQLSLAENDFHIAKKKGNLEYLQIQKENTSTQQILFILGENCSYIFNL